jgi:hypothetical protein
MNYLRLVELMRFAILKDQFFCFVFFTDREDLVPTVSVPEAVLEVSDPTEPVPELAPVLDPLAPVPAPPELVPAAEPIVVSPGAAFPFSVAVLSAGFSLLFVTPAESGVDAGSFLLGFPPHEINPAAIVKTNNMRFIRTK